MPDTVLGSEDRKMSPACVHSWYRPGIEVAGLLSLLCLWVDFPIVNQA